MADAPQQPIAGDTLTFWMQLLEKTRLQMSLFRGVTPRRGPELAARQGTQRWSFVVGDDASLVALQIAGRPDPGAEPPATLADRLLAHRAEIDLACGARLVWRPSHAEGQPALVVLWRVEDFGPGTTGDWPALQDRLVDAMARLQRACRPHLAGPAGPKGAPPAGQPGHADAAQAFADELITACYLLEEETGYRPEAFLRAANRYGGLEAARRVLRETQPAESLKALRRLHRLEISVEAFALRPEYAPLFSEEERATARHRLRDLGYPI